jgi:hypothetical protein
MVTGCTTGPRPIDTDQEWREALNPAEGYTAEQTRAFHDMFDLTTWQVTQDNDYERYPRMRPTDRHLYWSVSRTLAGLMIGQLEAEGRWPDPAQHQAGQWDAVWADGDFYKGGFRGQGLYVSPSRDLVIAFFSSAHADQKFWARELARSGLF